ncbi:hypothetical protein N7509_012450 [Penicillium cosmopolitanum]|uniref:Uncharacterized protein n=1 Tax=Penicillium cosmopolitanum TaxID=1131564 RepID=A0A9W9VH87_9EURO|nr:uncharacterized protein N7509_012450 [Penicillium cosmopolitanum]KAJ5379331.1 hypothetical protein N7509_012450 [Penicillium cosmopolitanum]
MSSNLKQTDPVPAYEELFEERPQNKRTGYSHIPPTDPEADLESQAHTHEYGHDLPAQADAPASGSSTTAGQQPPREHFHCETCDLQLERREKRDSQHRHCQTVASTFLYFGLMITLILVIVVPTVAAMKKRRH